MHSYEFTFENIKSLINSHVVADDGDAFELEIDKSEVSIKKPYVDDDGDELGNSIRIENNKGVVVYISIQKSGDQELAVILFKANKNDSLKTLNEETPQHIKDYANEMWVKTIDAMNAAEVEWEADVEASQQEFTAQFGNHQVPEILQKLFVLEKTYGLENFSECFCLSAYDKTGISTWSNHPDFLNAFIEFARANGSGSSYAFWTIGNDLINCPIVVFGDEGGIHIVADNIKQLLHLLTFDTEISVVHDQTYFYRDEDDEDYEESEKRDIYLKFVQTETGKARITTMEECDAIIATAQEKYKDKLAQFIAQYVKD